MHGITTGTLLCQKVYTKCASAAHISKRIFRAHILYYKLAKLLEHLQSRGKLYTTLNLGPLANGVTICVSKVTLKTCCVKTLLLSGLQTFFIVL